MYTKEMDNSYGKGYWMGLETFFAIMHDRLVPAYLRRIVDGIEVNIGSDKYADKFRKIFGAAAVNSTINIEQVGMREEKQHTEDLTPTSFVLNFLQKRAKTHEGEGASLETRLTEKGLAAPK